MRILHYSHDAYGEGHLQRTLETAKQIACDFPEATQLLVSGTPQPRDGKLPKGLDFIKLPRMDESIRDDFHAPSLMLPFGIIRSLRENIILETTKHFKPDFVFIESSAMGQQEMSSTLQYLKRDRPDIRLVMNVRHTEVKATMVLSKVLFTEKMSVVPQSQSDQEAYDRPELQTFTAVAA